MDEQSVKSTNGKVNDQKSRIALEELPFHYRAMLVCFMAIVVFSVFAPFIFLALIASAVTIIYTLVLGIRSRMEIKHGNGDIKDNGYSVAAIVVPVVLAFCLIVSSLSFGFILLDVITPNFELGFLRNAIEDYAEKHDGQFPPAENWNDVLKENDEAGRKRGPQRYCRYAINPEAVRLGADAPGDMVLLFEVNSGWNQAGGLELLRKKWGSRSRIVFVNFECKTVRKSQAGSLRWSLERSSEPGKSYAGLLAVILSIACIVPFIFIVKRYGCYFREYVIFGLLLTAASAGIGAFLGFAAEVELYSLNYSSDVINCGWVIGAIVGAMTAICYILLLGKKAQMWSPDFSLVGYGTMLAVPAGVICAAVTHGFLMIFYEEFNLVNLGVGIGFGAFAGIILGWISSWDVTRTCKKRFAAAVCCEDCKIQEVDNADF
jgi:hypothetical protein